MSQVVRICAMPPCRDVPVGPDGIAMACECYARYGSVEFFPGLHGSNGSNGSSTGSGSEAGRGVCEVSTDNEAYVLHCGPAGDLDDGEKGEGAHDDGFGWRG